MLVYNIVSLTTFTGVTWRQLELVEDYTHYTPLRGDRIIYTTYHYEGTGLYTLHAATRDRTIHTTRRYVGQDYTHYTPLRGTGLYTLHAATRDRIIHTPHTATRDRIIHTTHCYVG